MLKYIQNNEYKNKRKMFENITIKKNQSNNDNTVAAQTASNYSTSDNIKPQVGKNTLKIASAQLLANVREQHSFTIFFIICCNYIFVFLFLVK